ncbi:MAG TPA: hypothetical protein PK771_08705, partial [Spirochaetota bacterium]|nr:hypothetical protein [Spirochaetota bacterium]
MKGKTIIFLLLLLSLLISCSDAFLDLTKFPAEMEKKKCSFPEVSNFESKDKQISIFWNEQKSVNYYELYREDIFSGSYEKVYSGVELFYIDKNIEDNKFYNYRVNCYSETIDYEISDNASGIYSSYVNNEKYVHKNDALQLEFNKKEEINYYGFFNGFTLKKESVSYFKYVGEPKYLTLYIIPVSLEASKNLFLQVQVNVNDKDCTPDLIKDNGIKKVGVDGIDFNAKEITVYFRISTLIQGNTLTQSVGSYSLELKNEQFLINSSEDPNVTTFSTNSTKEVKIDWKEHARSTGYELYRDASFDGMFNEKIYSGTELQFIDNSISENKFYFYKLKPKSDYYEYRFSNSVCGIYSKAVNDITNLDQNTAVEMDFDKSINASIYSFDNNINIKKTSVGYYKYIGEPKDLVLSVKYDESQSLSNTAVFLKYIIGTKEGVPIRFLEKNYSKIQIGDIDKSLSEVSIYFKIWTETISNKITEDVGAISLELKNEYLIRKNIFATISDNKIKIVWDKVNSAKKY